MSNNHIGLGIIRNLQGYDLDLLCLSKNTNFVCSTRYLSNIMGINAETEPGRLLQILIKVGEKLTKRGFIIPASEIDLMFLSSNRDILSRYYYLSVVKEEALSKIMDKYTLHQELTKRSFNSPHSLLFNSLDSIDIFKKEVRYPCIMKPVFSGDWKTNKSHQIIGEQKAIVIHNEQELVKWYNFIYTQTSLIT